MRPFNPSDRSERDRFLKHLKQRPAPERPLDYGRQSPRLLTEIVEGMRADNDSTLERGERIPLDLGGFERENT